MGRSQELASRLQEVLLDGRWVANTNCKAQLENLSWEVATQKVGNLNTIAALTFHINYYLAGLIVVFQGGALEIRDKYSFDLPPINSQADWEKLVNEFLANSETFVQEVAQLSDNILDQPFVDEKYGTYLRNIEGIIEHTYYHLGQISMLKKLIAVTDA
ncbi:DinB family protein [Flagellimonas algicola]|uniref:DinB family protein n=1 Tax=Flagellimonas algicola TaxID=2583815 RepID=A0ABY2WHE9_9FLAO|nr:DinB family protein [Allomuricauda algicola]TMU51004.1 DinB family protein [Allomuricauda algicola]